MGVAGRIAVCIKAHKMEGDLIGKRLGDFEVEKLIGRGSMARVYRAHQISLKRRVALKVMSEGLFTPGEAVSRFMREAEAMARLEHPNIVPVYAAGESAPYYYFAMRLIEGGTLGRRLTEGVPVSTGLDWMVQVASALAHSHRSGIIHRDLKPSNILISNEVAMLADFGLARLRDVSSLTAAGVAMGTPLYMSPEQAEGRMVGPETDCFSAGVILYAMLTGFHPFISPDTKIENMGRMDFWAAVCDEMRAGGFTPPRKLASWLPREADEMIAKALAPEPDDRFRDGEQLLVAVRRLRDACAGRVGRLAFKQDILKPPPEIPAGDPSAGLTASTASAPTVAMETPPRSRPGKDGVADLRSAKASPLVGKRLPRPFGKYRLLEEVGYGGQGIVYRAEDPALERTVALKVLQGGAGADATMLEMFEREAKTAARLLHPHIVPVFEYGTEEGCQYLTMPWIPGPSLDVLLAAQAPLPAPFALDVVMQIGRALAYAHRNGVFHLDVKPGNILIQDGVEPLLHSLPHGVETWRLGDPICLLTDFTMARLAGERRRRSGSPAGEERAFGSAPYTAPEAIEWEGGEARSDIFSLGVVLYETVTGVSPFLADSPDASRLRASRAEVPPPSTIRPGLPTSVDEICRRSIRREPSERYASAEEFADAAEEARRETAKSGT
ncbi:MAG: serine/threonine protein kinase [Planctomycetota bacterium]|nr:serine/threonine protein kinase [Planctomycetota bacterium]